MRTLFVTLISIYQKTLSPDQGVLRSGRSLTCPLYPTCSEYTKQAIMSKGVARGVLLGARRVLSCGPRTRPRVDAVR